MGLQASGRAAVARPLHHERMTRAVRVTRAFEAAS
jgi:hypothetical protein